MHRDTMQAPMAFQMTGAFHLTRWALDVPGYPRGVACRGDVRHGRSFVWGDFKFIEVQLDS